MKCVRVYKNKKRRRSGRKKRRTEFYELRIDGLLHGPEGVGRVNGRAVFVPRSVPGDLLKVRIREKRHSYWRAEIVNVLEASPQRRKAPCHVFGRCGGCQWLHVDYRRQLEAKVDNVLQSLKRLGGIDVDGLELLPPVPSPSKYHYRMRTRLSCRIVAPGMVAPGFKAGRSHRVVSHDDCRLYSPSIRKALFSMARRLGRGLVGAGFTCHGARGDEGTVLRIDLPPDLPVEDFRRALEEAARHLPLAWELRSGGSRVAASHEVVSLSYSIPRPDGGKALKIEVPAGSFFQANLGANPLLVETVIDLLDVRNGSKVLDLFAGCGNFSLPIASLGAATTAMEVDERAVDALRANAESNGTEVECLAGDAAELVGGLISSGRRFDACVLDPPREGAPDLVPLLSDLGPERLVYVSCDPPTLARDLKALASAGFRPERLRVLDLFPQTYHVETVVALSRHSG